MHKKHLFNLILSSLFLFLAPILVQAAKIEFVTPAWNETVAITESPAAGFSWQLEAITPAFSYSFTNPATYDPSRPMTVKISYDKASAAAKKIYVADSLSGKWTPLKTSDNPTDRTVTATISATAGKLVVLADSGVMSSGKASWYAYKNGLFAASPDYLKGTVLRVTNLANGKYVDVTVNDYGPDRRVHPDRVIDLDKVAFQKIASLGAGIIEVKVEPLKSISSPTTIEQTAATPTISASSAVVIRESDGQVIFSKNENKVAPLASLTKLVAAKVFLDTNPDLKKVVTYKNQDSKFNHLYVTPGQEARLRVKDGETMTINDLLFSALVGSANNAVESLVRVSGLSRDDFIARMNSQAKNWGATNTKFIEPTGLAPENVSSPYEYAIMMKEVLKDSLIKKISTTASYSFSTANTKIKHTIKNTNKLLAAGKYQISGSKTGYLDEAGYCLMTKVQSSKDGIIVVNFNSPTNAASFSDNEQLIKYGLLQIAK